MRKNIDRNAAPLSANAPLETRSARERNSRSGTSGAAERASTPTKTASSAPGLGVPYGRHEGRHDRHEGDDDRYVDEEDPPPAQRVDEQAAGHHAQGAAEPGEGTPDAHGDVAFPSVRERDGEDGQRRGGEQRAAQALHGARGDQQAGRGSESGEQGHRPEQHQTDDEDPAGAEQVCGATAEQQETTEEQGVRADHPLQVVSGEAQIGLDVGQRHVHDRHVEDDDELRYRQHRQSCPGTTSHAYLIGERTSHGAVYAVHLQRIRACVRSTLAWWSV
ncbi:hypothetical protein OG598_10330 [Micromonospora sp. NBC_00330]|nr:hypothetical protein [Micromonospora sp. NBC_00330]